jgi:hypothetical protein
VTFSFSTTLMRNGSMNGIGIGVSFSLTGLCAERVYAARLRGTISITSKPGSQTGKIKASQGAGCKRKVQVITAAWSDHVQRPPDQI